MAKLPFGDASSEPLINPRADPAPLLAEIAQCALDATPMRPALASWFYGVWQAGRIGIKKVRGKVALDTTEQRSALLFAIRGFSGEGVEREIERLRIELGIKASVEAIHGWRRQLKEALDSDVAAWAAEQELLNIQRFESLAKEGIWS